MHSATVVFDPTHRPGRFGRTLTLLAAACGGSTCTPPQGPPARGGPTSSPAASELPPWLEEVAEESGLDPVFTEKFLRFIVAEVIHHHQRIAEGEHL